MLRTPLAILTAVLTAACATSGGAQNEPPPRTNAPAGSTSASATYEAPEIVEAVSDWLGVSAETAGAIVERVFAENGRPNAYIYGGEGAGAAGVGLRYGEGTLVTRAGESRKVYWQGPSVGWDIGGNASKTFTLVYGLPETEFIFRRFPGVEGSAYFIGGVGVNYQRAEGVTLAPMRAGVGLRAGANIGYLSYSKTRKILPF